MKVHPPGRLVLSGPHWRVVAVEWPDQHGVVRTDYVIELTDPKAVDSLGVQQWTRLTDKSAWGDWMRAARGFLEPLLKAAGETPDAPNI